MGLIPVQPRARHHWTVEQARVCFDRLVPDAISGQLMVARHPRRGTFNQAEPVNVQELDTGRVQLWLGHRLMLGRHRFTMRLKPVWRASGRCGVGRIMPTSGEGR
ncbi:hypothetical protein Aple_074730 [Acrocarpospora pleiomorpha]|uniref:Uncharacterized protein n=1 Tax=Acrocarpospora pleiomorpha TaxID=90975 RepID=A0A5M3XTF2_9ACTN|nr:hypothetical protein Aple_074730 [Acrocarpospora pleiomorpha]